MYHKEFYENENLKQQEEEPERRLWRIVKNCKSQKNQMNGCKIMKGDIMKFGRIRFRVRELNCKAYPKNQKSFTQPPIPYPPNSDL